eukprot:Sspe_Gene.88704::Locus_60645_Transcript_1_1_Confidence_1.000_Length_783::g.88704::m.88704
MMSRYWVRAPCTRWASSMTRGRPGGRLDGQDGTRERNKLPTKLTHYQSGAHDTAVRTDVAQSAQDEAVHLLNRRLGDVTDILDDMEYNPSTPDWDDKLQRVVSEFEAWKLLLLEERRKALKRQPFDHWFVPRMREVENWIWIVKRKREQFLRNAAHSEEYVKKYLKDRPPPSPSTTELKVVDEIERLEAKAMEDIGSMTNDEIYFVWRAKGRPVADPFGPLDQGSSDRPLDVPGYYAPRKHEFKYSM